jgi:branched-chain amino acid transport system permease protein
MNTLLFSIFNGVLYGLLLFMLSSGLTLIFSMMGVLNFAHASFFMIGAFCAYTITKYVGFWPALIFAPVAVGVIGALVERYGLRVVHKSGHVAELLFTFGLYYAFEEFVQMIAPIVHDAGNEKNRDKGPFAESE